MSADRELLFGFLALQNDCVSRENLIAGVQVWLQDKSRRLADILVQRKSIDVDECELLLRLTERHLKRHGDDAQQSLAVLSSLGPLKSELQRLGDADVDASIAPIGRHRKPDSAMSDAEDPDATHVPQRNVAGVGSNRSTGESRFRILRPHARGGLGEVFVARDEELNREVALKEIQSPFADDPDSRSRFVLEAEVTGGLEHPGIVPVYGLGQYDDGRPYYAMRFIKGDSLKEAIEAFHGTSTRPFSPEPGEKVAGRPDEGEQSQRAAPPRYDSLAFRKLLGRFIDVCQAISYAHSRGVLHRDLKPGNIMLGKYGETLVVDWGLAKVRDRTDGDQRTDEATLKPSSGSGITPTVMGSAIGTPAYMPPEQAAGKLDALGPASDVYSLGATLYHLLTGRAAFRGTDPEAILKDVQAGRFATPKSHRADVPKSLEAVCLKAMSLRPGDRYGSPQRLADDIEHYLADEPVSAFAEPMAVRARRWVRKNQTLATTTAAVLLLSAVGLGVFSIVVSGKNTDLAAANVRERDARTLAETNEKSAREQSQLALSTLTSVITDIQGGLKDVPGGGEVRRRLLATSLEKLESVSKQFLSHAAVDRSTWQALISMGDVILTFGTGESATTDPTAEARSAVQLAESYYQRALQIAKSLADANPNDIQKQRDVSVSFNKLGYVLMKLGRTDDALLQFQDGLNISRQIAQANPTDVRRQRDLSISFEGLGDVLLKLGRGDDALTYCEDGLKIRRLLAEADPDDAGKRADIINALNKLGNVFQTLGRADEALAMYQEMLTICRERAEADPNDPVIQRNLSISLCKVGEAFLVLGRTNEALTQFESDLKISRMLAISDPNDAEKQRNLSVSFNKLGEVLLALGRTSDALEQLQEALKITRALAEADPRDAQKQVDLSIVLVTLGNVFHSLGKTVPALEQLQEALTITRALAEADPNDAQKQRNLMVAHYSVASVRTAREDYSQAAEAFESAAQVSRVMIERGINVEQSKEELSTLESHVQLARLTAVALGDWEELLQKPAEELAALLDLRGIQCSQRSRFTDAAQAATKLRELESADFGQLYNAACVFSLCAASIKAAEGSELTAEQVAQRQAWINEALASLKLSIDKGWTDFAHMQQDSDLTILRDLPEFNALIPPPSPAATP